MELQHCHVIVLICSFPFSTRFSIAHISRISTVGCCCYLSWHSRDRRGTRHQVIRIHGFVSSISSRIWISKLMLKASAQSCIPQLPQTVKLLRTHPLLTVISDVLVLTISPDSDPAQGRLHVHKLHIIYVLSVFPLSNQLT